MRALVLTLLAGCQLDPLVDDDPQVSVHVLPEGAEVPSVQGDPELVHQIEVNDGLDDDDLEEAEGVVPRETGWADGAAVSYWAFGNGARLTATAYILVNVNGPIDHPWIFDGVPGDPGYSAIRRLSEVRITEAYDGEVLPSIDAVFDAIELGLVLPPEPTGTWVDAPVVVPGTRLDVGADADPAEPLIAYADGWAVPYFQFGGELGEQPLRFGNVSTSQVSRLREGSSAGFTGAPVFQLAQPTGPATDRPNWLPLVTVIEVRLAAGITVAEVDADADLYVRSSAGSIASYTPLVDSYTVTTSIQHWPTQLVEGKP